MIRRLLLATVLAGTFATPAGAAPPYCVDESPLPTHTCVLTPDCVVYRQHGPVGICVERP